MLQIRATIEGLVPGMLMNPATEELLESLRTGIRPQVDKESPPEKIAEGRIYRDTSNGGKIGIPAQNLYSSMIKAGRHVKNGKKQISIAKETTLPSFLHIEEEFLPFTKNGKWVVDKRRGVMDSGGKKVAVCIIRPKFPNWELDVTMTLDEDECSPDTARKLLDTAGKKIGVGDFRPTCNGPFGRFRVTKWKTKKVKEGKK